MNKMINLVTINEELAAVYLAAYSSALGNVELGIKDDFLYEETSYDAYQHEEQAHVLALQSAEETLQEWIFEEEDLERRWEGRRKYRRRM